MRSDYEIIDTLSGLEAVARSLEKEKAVAVDLEADSMYHFREKICLIQMATKRKNLVVDPLRIKDLSPLKSLFLRQDIQKIFHGADYDIRSLYRDHEIEVNNLFDTELACRFIGIRETGLEAVLIKFFNINLNKKYQKKDWSKRPLPQEMMDYAARDVKYLLPLYEMLKKELDRKNRLSWVHEECACLSNVRPASSNDDPLFMKFKGAGRLRPSSLAVLEAVLQYRKRLAEEKNRPLFKVFGNAPVMKIATARPVTLQRLNELKVLSQKQIDMYGKDLIETASRALKLPESKLPVYPRKKAPVRSPEVPKRAKVLKEWRDKKAGKLDIDPALVCNKAMITAIAVHNPRDIKRLDAVEDMKNWQKTAFGEEIIAVLQKN
ncbi:MAG: HRDC domain-containing protein [Pseudomonadota bacterium]